MYGTDLSGANLSDADLTSATVGGRCDSDFSINGADLYGANLTDTNLTSSDLGGVYSYIGSEQCIAQGAELSDITLSGADLSGAQLVGVTSGNITGQPVALPVHWLLDTGTLYGPGATCSQVTGKTRIKFQTVSGRS